MQETTKALRFNENKIDYTLLPFEALKQEALAWMHGAKKYGRLNWQKGWGTKEESIQVALQSLLRHALAIQAGELIDSESDLPHAALIRCNAAMILEFNK